MGARNTFRLNFAKGLNEYTEPSDLPDGYVPELTNWIAEPTGALRVARGWVNTDTTGLEDTRNARGVSYAGLPVGRRLMAAAVVDDFTYVIYALDADDLGDTWAQVETITVPSVDDLVSFAYGAGYVLYTHPDFPSANIRKWDGTTASEATTDAIAGRCLIYHNNRFFTGGSNAEPTTLRYSELGDATNWNTTENFQPIGADDGEPIEALASWSRGLFIGKRHSIWYQSGFGPDSFAWRPLDGGGVAPGRTLVATPDTVFAIGRERIWEFDGSGFEPISRPIETSYGMTGDYMTGAYIDGVLYVCDNGSGLVWRYDIAGQTWSHQSFVNPVEGPGEVFAIGENLYAGTQAAVANSIVMYRAEPGGDRTITPNSEMLLAVSTPVTFFAGVSRPTSPMHLHLQLRQRGGDETMPGLQVDFLVGGVSRDGFPKEVPAHAEAGVYRERVDLGVPGKFGWQVRLFQELSAIDTSLVDVELAEVEVEVEERR